MSETPPASGGPPRKSLLGSAWSGVVRFNAAGNRFFHRWSRMPPQHVCYDRRLGRVLGPARRAVHLGAGGKRPQSLTSADLSDVAICALDCSWESLRRNPNPARVVAWAHRTPLVDASVDVVFSEYLMEHVEDPGATLAEIHRILRPGGRLLWMAPNLWSYQGLLTKLTPFWFHKLVNRLLEPVSRRRAAADVFPTYFRISSIPRIRRRLEERGFEVEEICSITDAPHYTQFLPIVHQFAIGVHLILDRFEALRYFRMVQIVTARKPGGEPGDPG